MSPRSLLARSGAPLVLLAVLLAACGSSTASATPSATSPPSVAPSTVAPTATPDPATVYAQIEAQVQPIRELKAKTPVEPTLLDDATLKKNMAASFAKDNPPEVIAATQRLYELMGLVPAGTSLADLYVKLLGSQVAGYYDPDAKKLFVVSKSGGLGSIEQFVFAHEYDHALQDQNFGLKNLALESIGQGDASLAHLAVAEGDATLLMTLWAQQEMSPAEMLDMVSKSSDPEQQKILDEMPAILKQTLLFPYLQGLQLVAERQDRGRLAGGRRPVRQAAGLDRAGPPPRQVRGRRGAGRGRVPEGPRRRGSGPAGRSRWRTRSASSSSGIWLQSAGKVPAATATAAARAGAATGSRSSRTATGRAPSSTPAGTRRPTRRSSRPRRRRLSTRSAARTR